MKYSWVSAPIVTVKHPVTGATVTRAAPGRTYRKYKDRKVERARGR